MNKGRWIKNEEVKHNFIYTGDNLETLKTFPDNYFHSVVTDPPYGLGKEPKGQDLNNILLSWVNEGFHEIKGKGFMNKEWDAFVPQPLFWKEIFRVLKPGGYVLSFGGTRTYDLMVMALRLAGFEIKNMIAWIYGSGFPKSQNISKMIDKKLGVFDKRQSLGASKNARPNGKKENNLYQAGTVGKNFDITLPESDLPKEWDGWGTALKPAVEPIVMARKPLSEATVVDNVIKHGTGGINIDECRIPFEKTINPATNPLYRQKNKEKYKQVIGGKKGERGITFTSGVNGVSEIGRFPANIILDGSDEVLAEFPNVKSGFMSDENVRHTNGSPNGIYGKFDINHPLGETYGDEGSASRFFYVAKPSQSERDYGLAMNKSGYASSVEFRPNHTEKMENGENGNPFAQRFSPRKNIHPTVKPIKLIEYLVKMVTPKNGVVLDPYMGSGTTGIAAKINNIDYVGLELSEEYTDIANKRINAYNTQLSLFDFEE